MSRFVLARPWTVTAVLLILAAGISLVFGYRNATADPVIRRLTVEMADFPRGASPIRIVLFSDVHVHGPDMPPDRVRSIVEQINGLNPDIIVAAGDFVGNNLVGSDYSASEAIAPLAALKARLGVYAVLGNNDYRQGGGDVARSLEQAGVQLLTDGVTKAGLFVLGGLDGRVRGGAAQMKARRHTYQAARRMRGPKILVVHRPDEFVAANKLFSLVLAGHTHCGQIVLPFLGALQTGSDYGRRFLCGVHRKGSSVLVVTAGLGTSYVPLRYGAPPDVWIMTIEGPDMPSKRP